LKKYFLADRSNNQIDVIRNITPQTPIGHGCFAGLSPSGTSVSGPDGVLTVHRGADEDEDEGSVTELWVGDSPGRGWVFNAVTGANILGGTGCGNFINVTGTTRADELCFDSKDHLIMIASPGEPTPFVTFISTDTHKVVAKLAFDGNNGTLKATGGLE